MTHWLQGAGTLNWAAFAPATGPGGPAGAWGNRRPDRVRVVALLSYTTYVDRDMLVDEARTFYRELRAKGWTPRTADDARAAGFDVRTLQSVARD